MNSPSSTLLRGLPLALALALTACGSTQAQNHLGSSGSSGSQVGSSTGTHLGSGSSTTGSHTTTGSTTTTTGTSGLTSGGSTTTTTTTGTTGSTGVTTSGTTGSSSGSTGGSTTGTVAICGACTSNQQCQSGFCNTQVVVGAGFCDYNASCSECGSYGCDATQQFCQCPGVTTGSSSGSTGATTSGTTTSGTTTSGTTTSGTTTSGSTSTSGSTGTTGAPAGWTCNPAFYGAGDGCDCGCGVVDADCPDANASSCTYCSDTGSCAKGNGGCAVIDATNSGLCSATTTTSSSSGSTSGSSSGTTTGGTTTSGSTTSGSSTSGTTTSGTTGGYSNLIFSEYVTGVSNNKALELYNGTASAISLAGYAIKLAANGVYAADGGITGTLTFYLDAGSIAAKGTFVVCNSSVNPDAGMHCDLKYSSVTAFNGNDTVLLLQNSSVIDSIGDGTNPTAGYWGTASNNTQTYDLRRDCTVTAGRTNVLSPFDPGAAGWSPFADTDYSNLGVNNCP